MDPITNNSPTVNQSLSTGDDVRQGTHSSSIEALLSASRYIPPDHLASPSLMAPETENQPHLLGGFLLTSSTREEQHGTPTPTATRGYPPPFPEIPSRPDSRGKRLGRPLKPTDITDNKDSKERRRKQVRLAQRAYRLRGAANVETLQGRLLQLETAVQDMSEAIISFSGRIVYSGALNSHENLARGLREVLQTCVASTREVECNQETLNSLQQHETIPPSLPLINNIVQLPLPTETTPLWRRGLFYPQCPNSPSAFNLFDKGCLDIGTFTEQVRLSCIYNMLLMLIDPSVPLSSLRGPCQLLLSLMTRESMIPFFRSIFESRISFKQPEKFHEFPFFQLGGAGTHYPRSFLYSPRPESHTLSKPQRLPTADAPSSLPSPETNPNPEYDGKWFDIQDLLGYLQERGVRLLLFRPADSELPSSSSVINAISLLGALTSRAICLGQSPGFRLSDVEKALRTATWR